MLCVLFLYDFGLVVVGFRLEVVVLRLFMSIVSKVGGLIVGYDDFVEYSRSLEVGWILVA